MYYQKNNWMNVLPRIINPLAFSVYITETLSVQGSNKFKMSNQEINSLLSNSLAIEVAIKLWYIYNAIDNLA